MIVELISKEGKSFIHHLPEWELYAPEKRALILLRLMSSDYPDNIIPFRLFGHIDLNSFF